jgi:ABC-type sulfate transport system permease component
MDIVSVLMGIAPKLIDRLFPDAQAAADAKLKLIELQQSGELAAMTAQTDINKNEAASTSLFVSGWRPFIGWICGIGFGYQFLAVPLSAVLSALTGHPISLPVIALDTQMTILYGMLGIGFGGLRTYEKLNGVAGK